MLQFRSKIPQMSVLTACIIICMIKLLSANAHGGKVKLGFHGAPFEQIKTLQFSSTAEDFYKGFVRQSRPVLFRNAIKSWPAFHSWSNFTYLRQQYGQELFNVEFRKYFGSSFPVRKTIKLSNFIDEYQNSEVYLDSLFRRDSEMLSDIHLPVQLNCVSHHIPVENLNLLISSGNTSSAFHQDGYENLLSVVTGLKEVILYDSRHTRDFNADKYMIAAGVSDLDPENVDVEEYGILARMPYYVATLNPGDMLYIPKFWWHQVRSYNDPNVAIGIWFDVFNFASEFERRNIDETEQVVETTETFLELLHKEPLEIRCNRSIKRTSFFSSHLVPGREDICLKARQNCTLIS